MCRIMDWLGISDRSVARKKRKREQPSTPLFWAAVIIDMQPEFLCEVKWSAKRAMILKQTEVIRYCSSHNIPVVLVEYDGYRETVEELRREVMNAPKWVALKKTANDAFGSSDLEDYLNKNGINGLLFMGVYACACVYQTAKSAVEKKFEIASAKGLISDANGKPDYRIFKEEGLYFKNYRTLLENLGIKGKNI